MYKMGCPQYTPSVVVIDGVDQRGGSGAGVCRRVRAPDAKAAGVSADQCLLARGLTRRQQRDYVLGTGQYNAL